MTGRAALLVLLGATVAGSCRERGRPDPDVRMSVSHAQEDASGGEDLGRGVPSRLVVPPEVREAYTGIRLAWRDSSTGKEGTVDVPLDGAALVPGTAIEVRGDVFLPAFTMTEEVITSGGIEAENPAARIEITENGKGLFAGWIFTRFPDVHPFTHPRISIRLEGGVRRPTP